MHCGRCADYAAGVVNTKNYLVPGILHLPVYTFLLRGIQYWIESRISRLKIGC